VKFTEKVKGSRLRLHTVILTISFDGQPSQCQYDNNNTWIQRKSEVEYAISLVLGDREMDALYEKFTSPVESQMPDRLGRI
jgi:hypothetical protein